MYQDKHEYNVIKGVIPDFGYDVKFAIKVDNNKSDEIPDRQANNGNYYKVEADCGENTKAEWDYNAWNLKVDNIKSNSKCSLTFTSNLSESDYEKYIESGIEYRRNTYRGKNITDLKTSGKLYTQISNCTFDGIYVGDYILSTQTDVDGNKIKWLIADINNYLYTGDQGNGLEQCHATIIPEGIIKQWRINGLNDATGGYASSEMAITTLPKVLTEKVEPDFKGHIIEYRNLLTTSIDPTGVNQIRANSGASNKYGWYSRQIDLMSEVNVFGSIVVSSSMFDIGIDNQQYAIFNLKPELKYTGKNGTRYWYWLKGIADSKNIVTVGEMGQANYYSVSNQNGGIRPRFLIG